MKERKIMGFTGFLITALIFTLIGFVASCFLSASSEIEALSAAEKRCKEISESCREIAEEKAALKEKVDKLKEENVSYQASLSRYRAMNDQLSEVILRMRTYPLTGNKSKERLPSGMTNMIRFMDYRMMNKQSAQYKLQQECVTGTAEGIRLYTSGENTYYCAALGSAYGTDLGDTWEITLRNGHSFKIIYAEYKDDGSTDFFGHPDKNYDKQDCVNVIEFIVDSSEIPERVREAGTFTAMDWYGGLNGDGGNIVRMEYLGREWEP